MPSATIARMKTLFMHMGLPKTATTTLQRFCKDNSEALREKGIVFLRPPVRFPGIAPARNAHFLVGDKFDEDAKERSRRDARRMKRGMRSLEEAFADCERVLITDEALFPRTAVGRASFWPTVMESARRVGFEVRPIVYVRRQDRLALSWYNQNIKDAMWHWRTLSFDAWVNRRGPYMFDFRVGLSATASAVGGTDKLIVRSFDAAIAREGGIEADFLDALGIDSDASFTPAPREFNESICTNVLATKLIVNRSPWFSRPCVLLFRDAAIFASRASSAATTRLISPERALEVINCFRDSTSEVAQTYLCTDDPLFDDDVSGPPTWSPSDPRLAADALRFFRLVNLLQSGMLEGDVPAEGAPLLYHSAPPTRREQPALAPSALDGRDIEVDPRAFARASSSLGDFFCRRQTLMSTGERPDLLDDAYVEALVLALLGLDSPLSLAEANSLVRISPVTRLRARATRASSLARDLRDGDYLVQSETPPLRPRRRTSPDGS